MKIIYDGECPFCSNYVKMIKLKEVVGEVELIDARSDVVIQRELRQLSVDINQGMVLIDDDNVYYAEDCIHRIALLSTPSNIFNRLNMYIFRHKALANFLYPWMKMGRNITLKLLRKKKI